MKRKPLQARCLRCRAPVTQKMIDGLLTYLERNDLPHVCLQRPWPEIHRVLACQQHGLAKRHQ